MQGEKGWWSGGVADCCCGAGVDEGGVTEAGGAETSSTERVSRLPCERQFKGGNKVEHWQGNIVNIVVET